MIGIAMRIQVLPSGIIIGHVIPKEHPMNNTIDLKTDHVYELQVNTVNNTEMFTDIGEADVKMFDIEASGCGLDKFIVLAGGKHLTVNNGK